MFIDFFYYLRRQGLTVSITEWMMLTEALARGLADSSLTRFYHVCRAVCVKDESQLDLYDASFAEYFRDVEQISRLLEKVLEWLEDPVAPGGDPALLAARLGIDLDELREMLRQRLAEQTERHDGGDYWVGTGGTSPFGHSGTRPGGIRVGGAGGLRSAVYVAGERRFRNLRRDRVLDTRQIGMALRQLRELGRDGAADELDLDGTIDRTARNAGDIDLVFRPPRENRVKLLLLMDVGGSMTPYTRLCEQLFSAAHAATHFKSFQHYYFHNCPYAKLYRDIERYDGVPTQKVIDNLDREWLCVMVGDAAMGPYELTAAQGAIDYTRPNSVSGIVWLRRLAERFPRSVWLNPEPRDYWDSFQTVPMIREIFPMYALTLDGLRDAVRQLRRRRPADR